MSRFALASGKLFLSERQLGRKREAEFQWRRALSFQPEEKDAERIRRKLQVGLDAVLKEEGSEPLAVAKDGSLLISEDGSGTIWRVTHHEVGAS